MSARTLAPPSLPAQADSRGGGAGGAAAMPTMLGRSSLAGETALHYLGSGPVRVAGPVSGRHYLFSPAARVQQVLAQDAPALLGTVHFRRA